MSRIKKLTPLDFERGRFYLEYAVARGWDVSALTEEQEIEAEEFLKLRATREAQRRADEMDEFRRERAARRKAHQNELAWIVENTPERVEDAEVRPWSDREILKCLWNHNPDKVAYRKADHEKNFKERVRGIAARIQGAPKNKANKTLVSGIEWVQLINQADGLSLDLAQVLKLYEEGEERIDSGSKDQKETKRSQWQKRFQKRVSLHHSEDPEGKHWLSIDINGRDLANGGLHLCLEDAIERKFFDTETLSKGI